MTAGRRRRLRPWQKFLKLADEDLLAFALLYEGRSMPLAYYHAGQATEKYLKALVLKELHRKKVSVPIMKKVKKKNEWLFSHNQVNLAQKCADVGPFYQAPRSKRDLRRISRYNSLPRYPARRWSFSSTEVPMVERVARQVRRDLRLRDDYYPLAKGLNATREFAAAGYTRDEAAAFLQNLAVPSWSTGALALRRVFADPESLISPDQHWRPRKPW